MISRRTLFKKFRKWFEPCFNDPLRMSSEEFKALLMDMLKTDNLNDEDISSIMKKVGFQERRNIKGTFYIRPTLDFYREADKNMMIHRLSHLINKSI